MRLKGSRWRRVSQKAHLHLSLRRVHHGGFWCKP